MNILKVEMIAREINYKEGSQFFPSNFRSTWNVRSLQSILTLILLKSTEHILQLRRSITSLLAIEDIYSCRSRALQKLHFRKLDQAQSKIPLR